MTVKKAIKQIDDMINVKQRTIESEEKLLKSWGPKFEDETLTNACKMIIECLQHDIARLTEIKSQIKPRYDSKGKKKPL